VAVLYVVVRSLEVIDSRVTAIRGSINGESQEINIKNSDGVLKVCLFICVFLFTICALFLAYTCVCVCVCVFVCVCVCVCVCADVHVITLLHLCGSVLLLCSCVFPLCAHAYDHACCLWCVHCVTDTLCVCL
jgi:hypothetical protein